MPLRGGSTPNGKYHLKFPFWLLEHLPKWKEWKKSMIYFLSFALPFLFLAFLFSQPWSSELFFELGDGIVEEEFKLEIQILPAFWNHWDLLHCHWLKDIGSIIGCCDRSIHINLSLCRKSTRDKVNNLEDIVWKKFTQSAPTSSDSQVERLVSWVQDLCSLR